MAGKQFANLKDVTQTTLRFLVLVTAVFLFVAGCREEQPDTEQAAATPTVMVETAVPTEPTAEAETVLIPEIEGEISITSEYAVGVTAVADLATVGIDTLPANVTFVSDVFVVEREETAVTGQIALNTPADADSDLLDVYGWDGTAWRFIPSRYDSATGQRHTAEHELFTAVALGQAAPPDPMTVGGVWHEDAAELTEAIVSTARLEADGELAGTPAELPDDLANQILAVTNVGDAVESEALAALLADEAAQTGHIEAIVAMAEPFVGVNLNYQGAAADQQAAFATFVQNLATALVAQEKTLTLTLPAPEAAALDGLDEQWSALGSIADKIYLQLPLDPHAYGADGTVDQLLTWATDHIDRRKLVALLPTDPVMQVDGTWTALTAEEQLAHFGELELADDAEQFEPETAVEVTLSGDVSPIEWDETAAAYRYTVGDEAVWLVHPSTVVARLETAVAHNLQGVAFTTPVQPLDAAQADDPALVWTILDSEDNVVVTESGSATSFSWAGSTEPGEFTLQVDFVSGAATSSLGTLPITVAVAEDAEEVAETDEELVVTTGIVTRNANVRIGPGESFAKFPNPVLKDDEVQVIGRDEFGYWLQIVFTDINGEQTGWIATSLLIIDEAFDINTLADATNVVSEAPSSTVASAPTTPAPAATPAPAPPSGPPPPVSAPPVAVGSFELGGQTHTFANPVLMASAGMTWVKFQHKWGEGGNPNDLAGRIANAHAAGFKVLLSIPGANTYPDHINFGEYVQFLAGVAALGPDAIEVWNEMNIDFEWPAGQIDPASYVNNMLAPAYNAIKAANPNVMVISGAPAPTGFDNGTNAWADNRYMAGMLAAGGARYADCIGAHFNAGASSPSTVSGHPTGSAHYSWYLLPTLNVYAQLGKPVCFTELGYLSGEDYGGVPERFGWAAGTTVAQHAAWLAEAVSVAANTGKVRLIIVFNVDFTQWGDDPQAGYAMIRKNGGCPACETLARVMGR
jgi:hypothetical protein